MLQCFNIYPCTINFHYYDDVLWKERFLMMMLFEKEFPQTFGHLKFSFGKSWHFRLKKMTRVCFWSLESKKWKKYCSQITVYQLLFTDYHSQSLFTIHFYCSFRNFVYLRGGCPLSLRYNSFSRTSFFLEAFFRESSIFLVSSTISLQSL